MDDSSFDAKQELVRQASRSYSSNESNSTSTNGLQLPDTITSVDEYRSLYASSIKDPDQFWKLAANQLDWYHFPTKIKNVQFDYRSSRGVDIKWFEDGVLNVCYNCIDRHIERDLNIAQQIAIIFEPDVPTVASKYVTYGELLHSVKKTANVLKKHGITKGSHVTIYMPMVVEAVIALLACARIGAVHSVVFAAFSSINLAERIADCESTIIITSDVSMRGGKCSSLKNKVDEALKYEKCRNVKTVLVFQQNHIRPEIKSDFVQSVLNGWINGRDFWINDEITQVNDICEPEWMNAEDPLFILYTSGSTGKPKGILHTTGGYLTCVNLTFKYVFNYQPGDVYMCTADIGWITGHSYVIYGPLANRATSLIFEGTPTYPDASRYWQIIDKYNVNIFYTAPTVIRSLMAYSTTFVTSTSRESLRILGTIGEPINPEAWRWYHTVIE
ncbi:unnamed protein product [Adineta ricciae]|uniref:acetate--CoA ligase n=1 Tax=Adineta ricciae TaxID=249248 RepID=A0A814W243_ADIRI|nr:unnamed protein product [Adineta ricciae]